MKAGTEYWLVLSEYDWGTARDMMKSKRYVYVVFMCHLSTEKLIKGAVVEFTDIAIPEKIHALKRLADTANLDLTDDQLVFLNNLTDQQAKTRYPEGIRNWGRAYTHAYAQRILKQTEEFREWLLPLIKSEKS